MIGKSVFFSFFCLYIPETIFSIFLTNIRLLILYKPPFPQISGIFFQDAYLILIPFFFAAGKFVFQAWTDILSHTNRRMGNHFPGSRP